MINPHYFELFLFLCSFNFVPVQNLCSVVKCQWDPYHRHIERDGSTHSRLLKVGLFKVCCLVDFLAVLVLSRVIGFGSLAE